MPTQTVQIDQFVVTTERADDGTLTLATITYDPNLAPSSQALLTALSDFITQAGI